jgi:hypothetical protein
MCPGRDRTIAVISDSVANNVVFAVSPNVVFDSVFQDIFCLGIITGADRAGGGKRRPFTLSVCKKSLKLTLKLFKLEKIFEIYRQF